MKHPLLFLIYLLAAVTVARAQDPAPTPQVAKWEYTAQKKNDQEYVLQFKGAIDKGWQLFSTTMTDDNPNTRIVLDSASAAAAAITGISEEGKLNSRKEPLLDNLEIKYFENEVTLQATVKLQSKVSKLTGSINFMAIKGEEVAGPEEAPFRFNMDASGNLVSAAAGLQESGAAAQALKRSAINLSAPVKDCGGIGHEGQQSLWGIFVLGLLGGFIALLTPCVFPMIPLTVSFFTKKSQKSKGVLNASLYGFFIFLIYVLLSVPFHFLDSLNPEILNNISTNVWLNLAFFVIFIVFAISFFGYFEITLPSGLASKVDAKTGVGGIIGIFFMALTLALVSFSCTGPILGSLLAGSLSSDGGAIQLTMGMAGFGLALALPFAIFALFPNWLNSLPKSGGWLNSVKVVLGFLEIAMAIKFLSNADLVKHWGILKREVFFAIWIIIGICIVLYLLGKIRFPHDSPVKKLGATRIVFAVVFLALTLYMVPGVTNTRHANRALISGFPPPLTYSIYGEEAAKGKGVEPNVVNDYEKALQLAREQRKPILVDFTGWACVNCRKMEENVWPQESVRTIIEKEYILVSLYVDDRKLLPDSAQFLFTTGNGHKKEIRTIGDKFATMQTENFSNNSQPFYVLISPDEKLLTRPVAYTPDAKEYADWLKCGVEAYRHSKE